MFSHTKSVALLVRFWYMCVWVGTWCVYVYLHVWFCMYVCVCVGMHVWVCVGVCTCMCVCVMCKYNIHVILVILLNYCVFTYTHPMYNTIIWALLDMLTLKSWWLNICLLGIWQNFYYFKVKLFVALLTSSTHMYFILSLAQP